MSVTRAEAVEAMAQHIADVGEHSLALVGIAVDYYERAREIIAERAKSEPDE